MPRKEPPLQVIDPLPVDDEQTPLLAQHDATTAKPHDVSPEGSALEAQASQELREHEAGSVPVADEPTTGKLLMTMGSLWLSTIFAALGMLLVLKDVLDSGSRIVDWNGRLIACTFYRFHDCSNTFRTHLSRLQIWNAVLMD